MLLFYNGWLHLSNNGWLHLSCHGVDSTNAIRYTIDFNNAKVLDLTDTGIANEWGYTGGAITDKMKALGNRVQDNGFNVIKFTSERNPYGINHAVLDDFEKVLIPEIVVPTKP
jgi:hypothetical protein